MLELARASALLRHAALFAVASLAACSSSSSDAADPGGSAGSGAGGAGGGDTDGGVCTATTQCEVKNGGSPDPTQQCITTMDATLHAEDGSPIVGQIVYTCGINLCSAPGTTDATGSVHLGVCLYLKKPAFKVLGGSKYISFAAPMPASAGAYTWPATTVQALPADGAPFPAGTASGKIITVTADGDAVSGPATISLAASSTYKFDILTTALADKQLRAVTVDLATAPPSVDPAMKFDAVYSLAPLAMIFDPPAKLTLDNTAQLPAGTAVELFLHGLEADEKLAPYGGWGAIGTGTVSADGTKIVTDSGAGNGLPMLSMIGVRKKA